MLMLYNAVANDGGMMKPTHAMRSANTGWKCRKIEPQVLVEKICSDQTLKQVNECMLEVVNNPHGTARKRKTAVSQIAGAKTGTAVTALKQQRVQQG